MEIPKERDITFDGYHWSTYSADVTGLRLISLEDLESETVVTTTVADGRRRTAAHRAWAGARQSRAPGMPWEILHEMGEKGVDPDQKIDDMFRNYGHASVGDMARLAVDMGRIPMHLCLALFNEGTLNSGQEKSTRYQPRFGRAILHKIKNYLPEALPYEEMAIVEEEYQALGARSLEYFTRHREQLTPIFADYFHADLTRPEQKSALNSRVLDCARSFLLFGQWSGMSFETSARDWSRILAELKASPLGYYRKVAGQIERLLAPSAEEEALLDYKAEAPSLIRHTDAALTINRNLQILKRFARERMGLPDLVPILSGVPRCQPQRVLWVDGRYSPAERLIAEYLLLLWPGMDCNALLAVIHEQDDIVKAECSALLFAGHSNYNELPQFARTTGMTVLVEGFLGELRDLNRHRAWGRFIPLPQVFGGPWTKEMAEQLIARGFGLPLYLSEIAEFAALKEAFVQDLSEYYRQLQAFIDRVTVRYGGEIDYSFILNLLPLAQRVDIWLHGDPKQALYLTSQRARPGGHINYRMLAYEISKSVAASDQYLSAIGQQRKPDPASREEFFDRS
jgi:hypothetical protein